MSKKSQKATITNRDTGEQSEVTIEIDLSRGGPGKASRGFVLMWIDEAIKANLSAKQLAVLLALAEISDVRGEARYTLDELADRSAQATSAAWRSVEALFEKDIVRRVGRARVVINPNIVWKGSIADRSAAMVRWHNKLDGKAKVTFGTPPSYSSGFAQGGIVEGTPYQLAGGALGAPGLIAPAGWSIPAAVVTDMRGNVVPPDEDGITTLKEMEN